MLANELGLQPAALSNKLNGTGETSLKYTEARQIIKILAGLEAITNRAEAVELLELVNLKESSFTPEEWNSPPLNKLIEEPAVSPLEDIPLLARSWRENQSLLLRSVIISLLLTAL